MATHPASSARQAGKSALESVKEKQARLASSTDLNPMAELLEDARALHAQLPGAEDERALIKAVALAVRVVSQSFVALCDKNALQLEPIDEHGRVVVGEATDAASQVSRWLKQQWNAFVALLTEDLLFSDASSVRMVALEVCMSLQVAASESQHRCADAPTGRWSSTPFRALVRNLLWRDVHEDLMDAFAEGYLETYDDVRFFFCKEVSRCLRGITDLSTKNASVRSYTRLWLCRITAIPTEPSHLNNFLVPHLSKGPAKRKKQKGQAKPVLSEDGDSDDGEIPAAPWESDDEDPKENPTTDARKRGRTRSRHSGLLNALHSLGSQQQAFSAAWLSLLLPAYQTNSQGETGTLGGVLSLAETHDILVRLHSQILPHLTKPTMLHDFLVDCLDSKGTTALLALNGLFTLIVYHNLDYPAFYTRLYALLDASVMHTRYRSRFMRMLDTFLGSTHLPVAIVASFIKRASRLSLRATPAAIVEIVPFVWNLLKRHPGCMQMIHREWDGDHLALGPSGVQDGFNAHETNPLHTGALESSLWELASFGAYRLSQSSQQGATVASGGDTHYLGSVSTFASVLAEPFTQQQYMLEDFLDSTYSTMFETETKKTLQRRERAKKPVAPPPVAPLDITLSVPALLADKSGNMETAVRRETRKRLRLYAFPCEASPAGDTPLDESRRAMPVDDCAKLWDL